jgi:hypothetical protein
MAYYKLCYAMTFYLPKIIRSLAVIGALIDLPHFSLSSALE